MDWLLTFSDVLTLLITFFVLMISTSSMDAQHVRDTFGFFNGALGNLEAGQGQARQIESRPHAATAEKVAAGDKHGQELGLSERLWKRVSSLMVSSELVVARIKRVANLKSGDGRRPLDLNALASLMEGERPMQVRRTPTGVMLSVHTALLFVTASTEFRDVAAPLLEQLRATIAGETVTDVEVPVREAGRAFEVRSSWDLAIWRAAKLVRMLRPGGGASASARIQAEGSAYLRIHVEQAGTKPQFAPATIEATEDENG